MYIQLTRLLLSALVGAFCSWYVMDLKMDTLTAKHGEKLATIATERATEKLVAADVVRAVEKQRDDDREAQRKLIAKNEKEANDRLKIQTAENAKLRRCLDDGTCGLRFATTEDRVSGNGMQSPAASPADGATTTSELDAVSRSAYLALRAGIQQQYEQLKLCNQYAETVSPNATSP